MSVSENAMQEMSHFYRGRVALYAILRALDIGLGDEVAIQAFTCLAVPEGVIAAGATPLWIDIEADGFNMSAEDLRKKISSKTKAIVVQHTYGIPANMEAILQVAQEYEVPVIEDCAHTLLSEYKGRRVGEFGVGGFYSFEWGKPIVAGVGGSARVNDPKVRRRLEEEYAHFRNPPWLVRAKLTLQYYAFKLVYHPSLYWPVKAAFHTLGSIGIAESNYNPIEEGHPAPDFHWRMAPETERRLRRNIRQIQRIGEHSIWVSNQYRTRIQSVQVRHPILPKDSQVVFARYPLRVQNKKRMLELARKKHVELADWYTTPVHPLEGNDLLQVGYVPGACPNAERRSKEVVTLPTHLRVSQHTIDRIVSFFEEVGHDRI